MLAEVAHRSGESTTKSVRTLVVVAHKSGESRSRTTSHMLGEEEERKSCESKSTKTSRTLVEEGRKSHGSKTTSSRMSAAEEEEEEHKWRSCMGRYESPSSCHKCLLKSPKSWTSRASGARNRHAWNE